MTRCLLLVEVHSLLVTPCKITRYSLQNLLVIRCRSCLLQKIFRYSFQNPLVTRCWSCSLQKITRYSLQKLLVAKNHSLLVAKFACYLLQKLLVAKNHLLLVVKFTCYSLQKLLVAKFVCYLLQQITCYSIQKIINHSLKQSCAYSKCIKKVERFSFFNIICFLELRNSKLFQVNISKWNLLLAEHFQTQQYTNG